MPIPPGAAGTVIKCANCGTPIKLVSRKKPGGAGSASEESATTPPGAFSGPYAGTFDDASGFASDDPPALGECAQCGSVLADPSQLIEDRGRLICPNCAARSKISARDDVHSYRARPEDAAAEPAIGFREPEQIVVRHGPLISLNLATIGAGLAGCIAIAATIWLTFNPRPTGTRETDVKPAPVINVPPANPVQDDFEANKGVEIVSTVNDATDLVKQNSVESLQQAQAKYQSVVDLVGQRVISDPNVNAAVAVARQSVIDLPSRIKELQDAQERPTEVANIPPSPPIEPAPVPPAPEPEPEPATAPSPIEPASKPGIFWESAEEIIETPRLLAAGLRALEAEEFKLADEYFTKAIEQLPPPQAQALPAEHQLAYHGRGAALIGLKDYKLADAAINRVYRGSTPTPSLIFNRCLANYELDQERFTSLDQVAGLLKVEPTDQAVDLISAMLEKWRVQIDPDVRRKAEEIQLAALQTLEAQHGGRKRWGGQWVLPEEFAKYEGLLDSVKYFENEVKSYENQVRVAQARYDRAVADGDNTEGAKKSLDQWKKDLEEKKLSLEALRKELPEQPADKGFRPAIPEVPAGMNLPEE